MYGDDGYPGGWSDGLHLSRELISHTSIRQNHLVTIEVLQSVFPDMRVLPYSHIGHRPWPSHIERDEPFLVVTDRLYVNLTSKAVR